MSQHESANVNMGQHGLPGPVHGPALVSMSQHESALVSMCQHESANVNMGQHGLPASTRACALVAYTRPKSNQNQNGGFRQVATRTLPGPPWRKAQLRKRARC